jgi:hypothetical protein
MSGISPVKMIAHQNPSVHPIRVKPKNESLIANGLCGFASRISSALGQETKVW